MYVHVFVLTFSKSFSKLSVVCISRCLLLLLLCVCPFVCCHIQLCVVRMFAVTYSSVYIQVFVVIYGSVCVQVFVVA